MKKGNLFIAIKGKNNDGHHFVKEALLKGAANCIISKNSPNFPKNKIIKVDNTFSFLKQLAFLKRNNSNGTIIGVTGSSGKTSVKDLIGNLLQNYGKTYFSPKSFNNSYGVPLSICNLEEEHRYGVFEIGMSRSGEIDQLSQIVRPNIVIYHKYCRSPYRKF